MKENKERAPTTMSLYSTYDIERYGCKHSLMNYPRRFANDVTLSRRNPLPSRMSIINPHRPPLRAAPTNEHNVEQDCPRA